ncbi:hypothetical protein BC826DRAFT_975154, partial [Russula brevipes]
MIPEYLRIGSLPEVSQWTMERTIGNLGEEIRLHSDPYGNLGQRLIERAHMNALYSLVPELAPQVPGLPLSAHNVGDGYALLGPHELHDLDHPVAEAFCTFATLHGWHVEISEHHQVDRFARLLLPNGQVARSLWHEKKRPFEK